MLFIAYDNSNKYDVKDREDLLAKANMLTPSILAGTMIRKAVSKELQDLSDVVDRNKDLETDRGLNYIYREKMFKRIFGGTASMNHPKCRTVLLRMLF